MLNRRIEGDDDPALHGGVAYEAIDIFGSDALTARGLRAVNGTLVRSASFVECTSLKDDAIDIVSSWPRLETLDLSGCAAVTNGGVALLARCAALRSLNLSWLYAVGDDALLPLRELAHLRSLNLTACNVTAHGVVTLAGFRSLEWLALPLFTGLDDGAIELLSATASPLRAFAFGGEHITPRALRLLGNVKTLKEVALGGRDHSFGDHSFAAAVPDGVVLTFL